MALGSSLRAGCSCYRKSLWAAIKNGKVGGSSFHAGKLRGYEERGERARGGEVLTEGAEE